MLIGQKWREERDALVGQLQNILQQKDKELAEAKEQLTRLMTSSSSEPKTRTRGRGKSRGGGQAEIDSLHQLVSTFSTLSTLS